ncbi:hypothetical protein E4U43_004500 [Claviceps pusilla]|uniref:Rhodopsin domain-containing protein n=1 Tax=Claviceps pusilla TaxID=123648 RepID=A0A9P7N459_9HYPO|nr:hypothetical protein E4U43_004500 [Claviceps pusilla]
MSTEEMSVFAMYFYVLEILYLLDISLVKLTLLAFYLTIFPSVSTGLWTRRLLWACVAFNAMLAVGCILVTVFQCKPVSHYWMQFVDENATGSCLPSAPTAFVNGSLNVAQDLWMILIPLFEVRHLRLHWTKKAGVVFMFLLGTFVTVVSALRLAYLSSFEASINITWDYYDVALWSTIEINVGIICTSLPTMRLILVRLSPGVFGSQDSDTTTAATATATATLSRHSLPFSDDGTRRQIRLSSVATTLRGKDEEEPGPVRGPPGSNGREIAEQQQYYKSRYGQDTLRILVFVQAQPLDKIQARSPRHGTTPSSTPQATVDCNARDDIFLTDGFPPWPVKQNT